MSCLKFRRTSFSCSNDKAVSRCSRSPLDKSRSLFSLKYLSPANVHKIILSRAKYFYEVLINFFLLCSREQINYFSLIIINTKYHSPVIVVTIAKLEIFYELILPRLRVEKRADNVTMISLICDKWKFKRMFHFNENKTRTQTVERNVYTYVKIPAMLNYAWHISLSI